MNLAPAPNLKWEVRNGNVDNEVGSLPAQAGEKESHLSQDNDRSAFQNPRSHIQHLTSKSGFTLLELIVVIAVLGVLATVLLVALNPLQQFARGRDTGRISTITQLGRAMEAYSASRTGDYPDESATWITDLSTAGEISSVPSAVTYSIAGIVKCAASTEQVGYCYDASSSSGTGPVIVYARLEANSNISQCAATEWAYTVFSSADGRGGIVCTAASGVPTPGPQDFLQ